MSHWRLFGAAALALVLAAPAQAGCQAPKRICELEAEAPFQVRERAFDKRWIYFLSAPQFSQGERRYDGMAYAPDATALAPGRERGVIAGIARRRGCDVAEIAATAGTGTFFRLRCDK
ncbi:hypothetical protein [Salipiger abyssi]|uniref:hypothetical protein n=1 Tax=Salipiger abyssi TaxID=1250539 RepID=UPI001A8D0387|nr:hypothetical protein [Salipiger abyssi]MBN9888010.1 hypothetical protein [Salipiger abyssi]